MPEDKQIWLLTGANGAGKSTFYKHYLREHGIHFLNADLIAREIDPNSPETVSYEAADAAARIREAMLDQGASFCFETVFSHSSKIDFIKQAKNKNYNVILVYIHLIAPQLNEARVHQRTMEGGHNVPAEKIVSRIPRTMAHIRQALGMVDQAWILDNSSERDRFKQIAVMKNGRFEFKVSPLPEWISEILPW